jgi:hypothetical protein
LKRAYVEARYSPSCAITEEDLAVLAKAVAHLRDIVAAVSMERLVALKAEAGQ